MAIVCACDTEWQFASETAGSVTRPGLAGARAVAKIVVAGIAARGVVDAMKPIIVLFLSFSAMASAVQIHVSPGGDDSAAGTAEKPFATLQRARDEVRKVRPADGAHIVLHDGVHTLREPLVLTAADSGKENAPVVFEAAPGAKVVVSGGRILTGWRVRDGRWEVDLPEVKSGGWDFVDLFVGGERRPRARLPKNGWFKIAAELPPSGIGKGVDFDKPSPGHDRFKFAPGTLRADWHALGDVEVLVAHTWRMHRLRIAEIVDDAVRFTGATGAGHSSGRMPAGAPYLVENVREALSEPGEWYLDRAGGVLTYLPRPGEDPATTRVVAPVLDHFLRIEGASCVTFRGIDFAHARWSTPPRGHCFPQAEADVPAAIRLTHARHCVFEKCGVTLVGGYGVDFGAGTRECVLDDCEITHLGAGGVRLGGAPVFGRPAGEDSPDVAGWNTVRNCLIAHGGRLHPAAVGVWIGHSPHNTVEHCDIADFYYTGVSLGWSWGYAPSLAHHNTIAWCDIARIGQQVLSDMGGIYTLGNGPGNVLRGNHIHDVACRPGGYGGWGLYHDEGSTAFLSEDNVVHDTSSTTFHQHYGRENVIRNNIFAFGREGGLARTREEAHSSFTFEKNIVLTDGASFFKGSWTNGTFHLADNVYWDLKNAAPKFPGDRTFETWRVEVEKGSGSRLADPLFVDAAARDFRLKPGSPALALGFKSIDLTQSGRKTPRRTPAADVPRAWPEP